MILGERFVFFHFDYNFYFLELGWFNHQYVQKNSLRNVFPLESPCSWSLRRFFFDQKTWDEKGGVEQRMQKKIITSSWWFRKYMKIPKGQKLFKARWWFQIFFIFTPKIGEDSHFDEYFSKGLKPPTSKAIHSVLCE